MQKQVIGNFSDWSYSTLYTCSYQEPVWPPTAVISGSSHNLPCHANLFPHVGEVGLCDELTWRGVGARLWDKPKEHLCWRLGSMLMLAWDWDHKIHTCNGFTLIMFRLYWVHIHTHCCHEVLRMNCLAGQGSKYKCIINSLLVHIPEFDQVFMVSWWAHDILWISWQVHLHHIIYNIYKLN